MMAPAGQIRAKAPGKLYIAGEYAVTNPASPAILVAVDRYVTVTVTPVPESAPRSDKNEAHGTLAAPGRVKTSDGRRLDWSRDGTGEPQVEGEPGFFDFAFSALRRADRYAREEWARTGSPASLPLYDLAIVSDLAAPDGTKYGLGSSAAVCVAVVRAVLAFWERYADDVTSRPDGGRSRPVPVPGRGTQNGTDGASQPGDSRVLVFKLSAIAHLSVQGNGSLGDVASSSFGGWLLYHSFDRDWLGREIARVDRGETTLGRLVTEQWPALGLEPLAVSPSVRLIVGWSGRPASTQRLVARAARPADPEDYRRFVTGSAECVAGLAEALRHGDRRAIGRRIARNRGLLQDLARMRDVPIETDQLAAGVEDALSVGLAAKTSGAGLGDCLIALGDDRRPVDRGELARLWGQAGITDLPLGVAPTGQAGYGPDRLAGVADAGGGRDAATGAVTEDDGGIISRDDTEQAVDGHLPPVRQEGPIPDVTAVSRRRKLDHLRLADMQNQERLHDGAGSERLTAITSGFENVRLERPALPETDVADSDIGTIFLGRHVSAPFFIEAMTGGIPSATRLNEKLARIADRQGIALALGSASLTARDPSALDGFAHARSLTHGPVLANVNPATPLPAVRRLIDVLRPDALQVHVNAVQELVMGEGDRDFRWLDDLIRLRDGIDVPLIVKEVGFGWDVRSLRLLVDNGFHMVDIGGMGGTNFALIENARRRDDETDYSWLADCGVSTVRSLLNVRRLDGVGKTTQGHGPRGRQGSGVLSVIASGGVRTPLDVLKSLVLGAGAVGVAGRFLTPLLHGGEDRLDRMISVWKDQLAGLYALYGITTTAQATTIPYRILDEESLV